MAARTPYSRIEITIYDLNITEIREDQAGVRFTASLDLMPYGGPSMTDTHEIECRLEKNDDGWLFSEIRIIDVLER